MDKVLYIYSSEYIGELKKHFNNNHIISISYILNIAENVESIESQNFDEYIIDLTILVFADDRYRLFLESYLYELINKSGNIKFLVNILQKDYFLNKFPYIFDLIDYKYAQLEDNMNIQKDMVEMKNKYESIPLFIYSYTMLESIIEKGKVIPIGCLFNGIDNLNFNIDNMKSFFEYNEIQYIDISPIIDFLDFRKDLILSFDIILRQIFTYKNDIKFLICNENLERIKKYLPFTFKIDDVCFNKKKISCGSQEVGNGEYNIEKIVNIINNNLKGHNEFKKDFEFNLKKYIFLNKLKERKIFSIFLTGESGIGKTEFAKIISEAMYPSESLIKINFGNYSNEGVLNSLIGSPLGYIGSEEGGELINKIKTSNSKIVLIDEFEKATPSVFHFFYELLEDGKFTDRHGIVHNMDGYIIIFTSNMSRNKYINNVPDPLKSRFDMVYEFLNLPIDEKKKFAMEIAQKLIEKIYHNKKIKIEFDSIENKLDELIRDNNLRSIKRKVEDIVISEYYSTYKNFNSN